MSARTVSPTDVDRAASDAESARILGQPLDNPQACVSVLAQTNQEIASFFHVWAQEAGELNGLEKQRERLKRAAGGALSGSNPEERTHLAQLAIERAAPKLLPRIEELTERVSGYQVRFQALDRIAGTTQSVLGAHRDSGRWEQHGPDGTVYGRRSG